MPSPLLDAVDRVCRDVIAPAALRVDADVVPRSHLDVLAQTGLLAGVSADASPSDLRRAQEHLGGACLSTWLGAAQHQTPLRLARAAEPPLRDALVPLMESGTTLCGVAFSHLRRWPQRPVDVERIPGAWLFSGTAPWYTGWGINDVAVIAGATEDGHVVFALVPAEATHTLRAGPPVDTVAVSAARTVPLHLDEVVVPDDGVLAVQHIDDWARADEVGAANVSPAVLGIAQAAISRLRRVADPSAHVAGRRLAVVLAETREEAYALIDEYDPHDQVGRRLELRARALRLCLDATSALVIARGGRSMRRSDDAQLLARWALFMTVQAQTAALRGELLRTY